MTAVGNRLTLLDATGTTTYSYDAGNELTVAVAPSLTRTTYAYDNNGNNTSQNAGGTRTTYAWDYENHMTKVTLTGNVVTTLVYDGDGLRRKKQTASDVTKFIWDDQDVLIETNDAGTTQVNYTQTPNTYGSLVSQRRSGTSKFYFYDALGSTSELTNSSQTQTDSYRYYAFGKGLASTGSTVNPYQYVGRLGYYNESSLALRYLRARWYDPNTGRFRSQDPIRYGLNWYTYVDRNPISRVDSSGLSYDDVICWPVGIGNFRKKGIQEDYYDQYGAGIPWGPPTGIPGTIVYVDVHFQTWQYDITMHCVGLRWKFDACQGLTVNPISDDYTLTKEFRVQWWTNPHAMP